jgi:hypothetical protein
MEKRHEGAGGSCRFLQAISRHASAGPSQETPASSARPEVGEQARECPLEIVMSLPNPEVEATNAALTGHADRKTTGWYTHGTDLAKREAAKPRANERLVRWPEPKTMNG